MRKIALALLLLLVAAPVLEAKPKLGPLATPILQSTDYFRRAPAPDYWAMAPFYVPQLTGSACSVAAIAMAINTLRGLPEENVEPVITQPALLEAVDSETWKAQTAEGGPGALFVEFVGYLRDALAVSGLGDAEVTVRQPPMAGPAELAAFRAALAENEASADTVMLVAFNQGVVTGDWDGPHASPVGAYDADQDRVLIMDVDREWYVPYWTDTATLLAALVKPAPAEQGPLAGDRGGWILIRKPVAR